MLESEIEFKYDKMMNLGNCPCPRCKQDYNGLSIASCISTEFSIISCAECGFSYEGEFCEEDLTDLFIKRYKIRGEIQ